jgi:SAM-dependent methyltransferase
MLTPRPALRHPSAHVIGIDLSPIQPEKYLSPSHRPLDQLTIPSIPPNCTFEIDDAEDSWVFPQKFDLIHGRALASCFTDPEKVIASAIDALAPGGWLEYQDIVIPMECIDDSWEGSTLKRWNEIMRDSAWKAGRDFTCESFPLCP